MKIEIPDNDVLAVTKFLQLPPVKREVLSNRIFEVWDDLYYWKDPPQQRLDFTQGEN